MVMEVDDTLHPVPKVQRCRIRVFDTGNGDTAVDRLEDGGYQFIIKDIRGRACCLLIADKAFAHCRCALNGDGMMRSFGLNSALMLAYAFATGGRQTLLIHASLVRHQGRGYAFVAKSGTGKSTQVAMWLRCIPGCDLMNDDNPVVRVIDGEAMIYGSPWSGKTPSIPTSEGTPGGDHPDRPSEGQLGGQALAAAGTGDTAAVVLVDEMGREAARPGL